METDDLIDFSNDDLENLAKTAKFLNMGAAGRIYGPITFSYGICALKEVMFGEEHKDVMFKKFEAQKDIWTSLDHRNIIKIHCAQFHQNALYILMGFAAGGCLGSTLRKIRQMNQTLPVNIVSDWSKQIAEGMLYLHEKKLVHRDLKPGNSK